MMNITTVCKEAWKMLWNYRALWLFGFVLALVGVSMVYPGPWSEWEDNGQWIKIKISDTTTFQVPGADMTIDLTAPGGVRVITPDAVTWREFNEVLDEVYQEESIDLRLILVELTVILVVSVLIALVARYVAETAVIRMVYEAEETGEHLSFWQGLRRGFSRRAGRLFFLDLVLGVVAALAFVIVFGLAVSPILLAAGRQEAVIITVGVGTIGLIVLGTYLWLAASAVFSLVLQSIRRTLVLDEQGFWASIRVGARMTVDHLKEVGLVWLVWMSIRLALIPLGFVVILLLFPVLILTILLGVALGGVPGTAVALIASSFTSDATSVIMGILAALPFFLLIVVSPIMFVMGLVEVYLSSLWTIAYHDLKQMERQVQEPSPHAEMLPASGSAD